MSGILTFSVRDETSEASVDALPVCHADDAPRLAGHLPEISGAGLYVLMGGDAVADVACPGCGLLPVFTPFGLRGITDGEWFKYCLLLAGLPETEVAA